MYLIKHTPGAANPWRLTSCLSEESSCWTPAAILRPLKIVVSPSLPLDPSVFIYLLRTAIYTHNMLCFAFPTSHSLDYGLGAFFLSFIFKSFLDRWWLQIVVLLLVLISLEFLQLATTIVPPRPLFLTLLLPLNTICTCMNMRCFGVWEWLNNGARALP